MTGHNRSATEKSTTYGSSAYSPAQTISQLGYYTKSTCDVITMSTITTLLGYHVAAFPNTRLVIAATILKSYARC